MTSQAREYLTNLDWHLQAFVRYVDPSDKEVISYAFLGSYHDT